MNLERDTAPTGLYDYLPRQGTIRRNAYTRKTRGRKIKVRARYIPDVGAPGKWRSRHMGAPGIGKLKEGPLAAVGYKVTSPATRRHAAVKRAVAKYGRSSTVKKLNAVAVYTRRTSPAKSKKFKADMKFAQRMKGGAELDDLLNTVIPDAVQAAGEDASMAEASDEVLKAAKAAGIDAPKGTTLDELISMAKEKHREQRKQTSA